MYKETLLLLLTHEIKDAFSRLGGYLYLLKHNLVSDNENKMLIQKLEEEFHENETYISEILAWSKEKRIAKKIETIGTSIISIIYNIIETKEIQNIALYKNINFVHKIPEAKLKIDKTLYTIILKNILKNALKFSTPNESILLKVSVSDNKVITSVTDKGIGLNGNKKTEIEKPTKTAAYHSAKGSGLALALCQEILKIEGGEIWAIDNPDKGASFSFSLPFN